MSLYQTIGSLIPERIPAVGAIFYNAIPARILRKYYGIIVDSIPVEKGRILDVGTGPGYLPIETAKKYPSRHNRGGISDKSQRYYGSIEVFILYIRKAGNCYEDCVEKMRTYSQSLVLVIAVLAACILTVNPGEAYFRDLGVGARPMGMGGAYVAVADDGNAVLWNAAGLAQLHRREITAMFAALYVGLDAELYNEKTDQLGYHFICYVHPSALGSFALSWSTFQSQLYDENTFCLSYGIRLYRCLYAGLNLKDSGWSIGRNEYTTLDKDIPDHGTSINGFTSDLSALCKVTDKFSIGFSAENLLPADVGLNTKENIPINLRGGIACRIDSPRSLNIKLHPVMEITYRAGDGIKVRMGAESWFFDGMLGARAGWNSDSATSGLSYRMIYRQWEMQLDYAFIYPLSIQGTYGSHRTSISVRF